MYLYFARRFFVMKFLDNFYRHQDCLYNSNIHHTGPPESMREHIVAASKVMRTGDWKSCKDYILAVSCWELFPKSDQVKEMITRYVNKLFFQGLSLIHRIHSKGKIPKEKKSYFFCLYNIF